MDATPAKQSLAGEVGWTRVKSKILTLLSDFI